MVGKGVLRECLRDEAIERVLAIGRSPTGQTHAKLNKVVRSDMFDFEVNGAELKGHDACFFCLGVSSAGMKEADYTRMGYSERLHGECPFWSCSRTLTCFASAHYAPCTTRLPKHVRRESSTQAFALSGPLVRLSHREL